MIPLPKVRIRTEGFVNGNTPQSYVDNVRRLLVVNGLGDLAGSPGLRTPTEGQSKALRKHKSHWNSLMFEEGFDRFIG